jgi:D-aminoacyl-tRNA deacylase
MTYENFLIVASKLDKAGVNITTQLSQFGDFKFYLVDDEIIQTENLDLKRINSFDFVIFASKHKSESKEKTLSVHAPGNWRSADFGGEPGKACKSSALFMKQVFEKINENMLQYNLKEYSLTLEATHHGPLIEKPCIFIEIGPTENEWGDRKAGFIIARAISETMKGFKPNPYNEIAIAIGGPHYCPNFNKIQLRSNVAISHVISQYAFPFTEQMIIEAIDKTEEELDFVLLDWKGLGNAEQRQKIIEILDRLYINHKKTSDISK